MKHACAFGFAVGVFTCSMVAAPHPHQFTSNFETGMRHAWESYPIAQDAGYDPTLDPIVDEGRKVLARRKQPTKSGVLRLGFVRRFELTAGPKPSISFAYKLPGHTGPFNIEVLAFHDGHHERYEVRAEAGSWRTATLGLKGLGSGIEIRAVSVTAVIPDVIEERLEQFYIDDVQVEALREKELTLVEPAALADDDRCLQYVKRSYLSGDDLTFRVDDRAAEVRLLDPSGKTIASGKGGALSRKFQSGDAAGIWSIEAVSTNGKSKALLLVQPQARRGLIFDSLPPATPELLRQIEERAKLLRTRVNVDLGKNIDTYNDQWLLPGLPSYFALLQPPSELALLEAIRFRYTKNEDSLRESRKILRSMAVWPRWVHPWFNAHGYRTYYPVGIVATNLTLASEFLGDSLTGDDRELIDRGLREKAIVPAFDEYVINNRIAFHTSNWIGHAVGGALLAALTSHDRDSAGYALGLYSKQADHIAATYTSDGAYGEGVSYQRFDMETSMLVAAAAKRHLGKSFDDDLIASYRYLLYASYGHGEGMDFGDSHAPVKPVHAFAYLASLNRDTVLAEFYLKNRESGATGLLPRLLWDHAVQQVGQSKDLPSSVLFSKKGNAIFRDSWSADSTVINLRAGPNFNHNHADQGSFLLASGGHLLIGEVGYSDYYKDPYYQPFTIQSIAHNTLLVDGDSESQVLPGNTILGEYPSIAQHFIGNQISVAVADLASVYQSRLEKYQRILVHLKNGPVVVFDQVKAKEPHRYSVLWHPTRQPANVDNKTNGFSAQVQNTVLASRAFSTSPLQTKVVANPLPLALFEKSQVEAIQRPHRVEYSISDAVPEATIATILAPSSNGAVPDLSQAKWKSTPNGAELAVNDFAVVSDHSGSQSEIRATWNNGSYVLHSREIRFNGATVTAGSPFNAELSNNGSTTRLVIEVGDSMEVKVSGSARDIRQAMGQPVELRREGDSVVIPLRSGRSEWTFDR